MKKLFFLALTVFALGSCKTEPDYVLFSAERLASVRENFKNDPSKPAFVKLIHVSDSLLDKVPDSVMDKDVIPPSGDKHDYMSQGPYWWPNPDTPDGLPYVRRDGEGNPEIRKITDAGNMKLMHEAVKSLAMAYFLTGEEKYAAKAVELLKVWYLDPETRMNPNLTYGQVVPGVYDQGRCIGIIDLSRMNEMYDHVRMIRGSKAWDDATDKEFTAWVAEFTDWLVNSPHGKEEKTQPNNHGTYYDLLVCTSYLFLGEKDKAAAYVNESMCKRFDEITAEGATPRELARTKAWNYTTMNLRGLLYSCMASEKAGVDMWHYTNVNGATIQTAIDWYKPYVLEGKAWDYEDIHGNFRPKSIVHQLSIASSRLDVSAYMDFMHECGGQGIDFLYFPLP